ncbi:hypothetical protein AB0395_26480 [Streptosporangium sp. NPDC051023]|uniref:hypothetical protein n=1 Tax=Streptosporangium sp. NPDC051023 TaxID=3155410 RepID=UPI00344B1461
MTHVIRYRELGDDVAVETYHEEDGQLVIVVNSRLSHEEQRAAVASALRAERNHGLLALPLLVLAGLRDVLAGPIATATSSAAAVSLCGTVVGGYTPPIVHLPTPPAVVVVTVEGLAVAKSMSIRRSIRLPERTRERSSR